MIFGKIINESNYKWWALTVVQFGIFFVGVNATIVNLALPSISKAFSSSISLSQLLIVVYSATIAVFLPITGQLPHFFGRKIVVISGYILFAIFSMLSALAPTLEILIIFQIFLAIGGAALLANSNAITHAVFPKHQHGLAMGINGTVASIGYGSGLILGGYLIEHFGWRSIFWLNFPFGLFASILALLVLSEKRIMGSTIIKKEKHHFDYWGAILFCIAVGSLVVVLKLGLGGPYLFLFILGLSALGFFILREMKAHFPLIDLQLFKNDSFTIGSITRLLITVIMSACLFLIPFNTQIELNLSPLQSGMIMAPFSIALFFLGPVGGRLSDKLGSVGITSTGFLACGIGLMILITLLGHDDLKSDLVKIAIAMFFLGWGIGFFVPSNNSTTLNAIPSFQVGVVSGFLWSMAYIGTAIGTALCALILRAKGLENIIGRMTQSNQIASSGASQSLLNAQKTVFWILLILSIIGFFLCLLRSFIKKKK